MKHWLFIFTFIFVQLTNLFAYNVGELIENPDGSKGVVFWVSPDGSHGWMVALTDICTACPWGTTTDIPLLTNNPYNAPVPTAYYNDTSGYAKTGIIRTYQSSSTTYPAGKIDYANGWYLPAIGQLIKLTSSLSVIGPEIVANGGTNLVSSLYWSSTEGTATEAAYVHTSTNYAYQWSKTYIGGTYPTAARAIRSFSNAPVDTTLNYVWSTGDTISTITIKPTETTTYSVTATNQYGCTQTMEKTMFVGRDQTDVINASICQGKTYSENGFNESTPGTYYHVVASGGCSLTIQLNLSVNPVYSIAFFDTVAVSQPYFGHGFNVTAPDIAGDYSIPQSYSTVSACDSIVVLNLHVVQPEEIIINDSICQGEVYNENGFNLSEQKELGIFQYERIIPNLTGCCDTTVTLNLTVCPATFSFTNATICSGKNYTFNGVTYSVDGYYAANLTNAAGCDSIATLRLVVTPPNNTSISHTMCEGSSYSFKGEELRTQGIYIDTLTNAIGCDSTITLNLTVNPIKTTQLADSFCVHSTYNYRGNTLTTPGIYIDTLSTYLGCDSIVSLTLTYKQAKSNVSSHVMCEGESYTFEGDVLTASGTYSKNYINAEGCDSIVTLHLTVLEPQTIYLNVSIKDGETYPFGNRVLTVEGIYTDSLLNAYNCDSTVILNLSVIKLVVIPEVFTPNDDSNNDEFIIKDLDRYPKNSLLVFNRWGNKVYEAKPYLNDWDGTNLFGVTVGGRDLPVGTYFYILDLGDGTEAKKGYIYLNR